MSKQILKGKELREKLLSGVQQLADTVTITLGPQGRNVGIENTWTKPVVIHDGVKVAREIELPDPFENFGAQLVQQASSKTADKAGDGTTTSTLLAYKILERGFEVIDKGANPMNLKKGMQIALDAALKSLQSKSTPVTTEEQMIQVATISAADKEMGEVIGKAISKVGKDGVVSVTEYEGMGLEVEYKEGMELDRGFISPLFATNEEKQEAEIESPFILLTDMVISSPDDLAKFLKKYTEETKRAEIVIIATDVVGAALSTLLVNKARGGIVPLATFAPSIGPRRAQILEDIATLTGGKVLYRDGSIKLEDVTIDMLGKADRVLADKDRTRIIGGFGDSKDIALRAEGIRKEIDNTPNEFEKSKLQERLARLVSGAAIIKVGAFTEVELSDRKERVIDAVEATKAAVTEGIVVGGGMTLTDISLDIPLTDKEYWDNCVPGKDDVVLGKLIVLFALSASFDKLLENAGIVLEKSYAKKRGIGINVETGEEVDLLKAGIIDPTRVVKEALQNAVSVAMMLLTTEAVVAKLPEKVESTGGTSS